MPIKKPGAKYQHLGVRVEINNKKPNLSTETNIGGWRPPKFIILRREWDF
jgi:hypothetical protein